MDRLKCLNVFHATAADCIYVYNYNYMHWYNIIEMLIELLIYSALVRARDAHIVYSVCIYAIIRCILTAGKRGQLIYKTIANYYPTTNLSF